MKKLIFLTTFLLFCNLHFLQGQNCPTDLPGFTFLGEFEDHHYFLSSTTAHPQDAQIIAEQNGGYLATITSQAENDFLQQNISEMTIIGLNDGQTEGDFEWFSGEISSYSNFDVCSFCLANSLDNDYTIIHHWDGTWSFANVYTLRKYIVEIPCQNTGSGLPDLTISNVSNNPPDANSGDLVSVNFNINNVGTETASGNFVTAAYLSTDPLFSSGDIYLGQVSESNLPAGLSSPFDLSFSIPTVTDGDYYIILIADVNGDIQESNTSNNGYEVPITIGSSTGSGCPDILAGFTLLGEHNNSKYFISNGYSKPIDAQAVATQNGGYLVSINDQAENDFIQQNITEMVYIGLNDASSEGSLQWLNGDALTYNNVDPCGFCEENSSSLDYVIMAPWNGTWSFSSQWNNRKYILEILCGNNPGTNLPDMTFLDGSSILNTVGAGNTLPVSFYLHNDGTATASSQSIGVFLSTDAVFDASDVNIGESNVTFDITPNSSYSGNTSTSIPQVSSGNYYVILVADVNNEVQESDENNNDFAFPIEIYSTVTSPISLACDYENIDLGTGAVSCTEINPDDSFNLIINSANNLLENSYSSDGSLQSSTSVSFEYEIYSIQNNAIRLTDQDGLIVQSIPLATEITNQFSTNDAGYAGVTPIDNNTFAVLAYERTITNNPYPNWTDGSDDLYALTVDNNGSLLNQVLLENIQFYIEQNEYHGILPSETGLGSLIYKQRQGLKGKLFELALDSDLSVLNKELIAQSSRENGTPSTIGPTVTISPSPCSPYQYLFSIDASTDGSNGSNFSNFHYEIQKDYSSPISEDIYWEEDLSANLTGTNVQRNIRRFQLPNSDGWMEVTNSFQQYLNYPASISKTIERYNEAGALQWSENYDFDNMPTAVFPTSNGDIHFVFENNGTASLAVPDCTTQQNCPDDIAGFEYLGEYNGHQYFLSDDAERPTDAQDIAEQNGGYLVVINDHAENDFLQQGISEMIYIGLNDAQTEGSPQWVNGSSSYSNYDICSFCNENSNNLDYVVMHNWNGGWSWSSQWNSRKYIVEIPCGNISPNTYPICSGANTQTFEKEIDLPNQTQIVDILENPTCGYFGVAMENNGYLVHLDHEGEYRWIKPITNGLDINSIGIRFLPNAEGFLIYGIMNNPEQFFMIKIDNAANVIWENIYNNINAIYHQPAILNSGEILCLNGNGDLIKFDADGNYLWANSDLIQSATTATPIYKTLSRIHELQDGHVMMIGYEADYSSYVPLPDIRIIKIDGEANVVFDKTINACCNRSGEYANIQATEVRPDGSIGLVLSSASNPGAYPISKLLERYTINPDGSFAGGGFCFPNTVNGNYSVVDVAFTSSNQIVVVGNFCSEYQQSTLFPPPPVSSCGGTSNFAVGCDAQNYQGNRQVSGTADGGILAVGGLNFVAKLNGNGTLNLTGNSSTQNTLISTIVNTQVVDDKFGNILLKELMPNPANERIFVSLYSPIEDNVELQIFDARGVLVKTETVELHDGDNTVDVMINDLPGGFYFLKIPEAQVNQSMKRFVKVRD